MEFYTVDAFASKPFRGNSAAVVPQKSDLSDDTLQKIAMEMNLSETCYLVPLENIGDPWKNGKRFNLRWFTPLNEIVLCGHATVAATHVLFNELGNVSEVIEYETLSGILKAYKDGDKIKLDFPSLAGAPFTESEEQEFTPLVDGVVKGMYPVTDKVYDPHTKYIMACIGPNVSRKEFDSIQPNFEILATHDGSKVKGIVLTTKGGSDFDNFDFASRFFAPWHGVQEDPATGSAHSVLTPFWSKKLNKKEMTGIQCSKRVGEFYVKLADNNRVNISGKSVTIITGKINLH